MLRHIFLQYHISQTIRPVVSMIAREVSYTNVSILIKDRGSSTGEKNTSCVVFLCERSLCRIMLQMICFCGDRFHYENHRIDL